MHRVKCDGCRNEVDVALYFSNKRIIVQESLLACEPTYEAACIGEAICPICGCGIKKTYKKTISPKDIVDLATGGKIDD